jgi:hypothetical protein
MARDLRFPGALLLACAMSAAPAVAQVGFDPAKSPYRPIVHGTYWILSAGKFSGAGGRVGAAPHNGEVVGLQVNFLADKTIQVGAGIFYGFLERNVIDPDKAPDEQLVRVADLNTLWVDAALRFSLTGGKTWRRLAPYVGSGFGVTFSEKVANDPGEFGHGTKFYLAPLAGTRFFLADRVYLQVEGRIQFWQVKYPDSWAQEPSEAPGTPEEPNAVLPDGRPSEWSATPWLQIGLGYTVRLPWPF